MLYCDCRKFNWPLVFLFFRSWWLAEEYLFAVLYLLTTVYTRKTILGNFVFTNSAVNVQHILFATKPFLHKTLVYFLSSNIPFYIEKKTVKRLCKVLEMELKTYTPVNSNFVFEKIKFNVLHYIQHNFTCPGLCKD